jgi:hypothetical protein
MRKSIRSILGSASMAVAAVVYSPAEAQQRCVSYDVMTYDLQRSGQTLQLKGDVTVRPAEEAPDPQLVTRLEIFGNTLTGRWTMVHITNDNRACLNNSGTIFFNEAAQHNPEPIVTRFGAFARHGNGDGSNQAFEIFAHPETGRWAMTLRTTNRSSSTVIGGNNFEAPRLPPYAPVTNIAFTP